MVSLHRLKIDRLKRNDRYLPEGDSEPRGFPAGTLQGERAHELGGEQHLLTFGSLEKPRLERSEGHDLTVLRLTERKQHLE